MVTPAAAGAVMAPTNNNAELVAAMQAIAFNTSVSARKEFDFDTFGTTIATKTVGISA
jgi:predicted regulator of Ras-like GTPase activity (Roadblock/LC7/MglB family)